MKKNEFLEKANGILLVDLDGTITNHPSPPFMEIGTPNEKVLKALEQATKEEFEIFIYTSRGGWENEFIKKFLAKHNIKHKAIIPKPLGLIIDDKSIRPDEFIKLMLEKK